jgi:sugar-phosphatase
VFLEEGSRKRPQITNNKLEILNIKAVIYDMDGLIIDSEPLWREAEKITFKSVGHIFTDDMCRETMGMRLTEVVQYWHDKLGWNGKSLEQVEEELLARVTQLIIEKGEALEGVESSLQYFKSKGYKIALASSSHKNLIKTVLKKLNITHYFEVINSAEQLTYGKPHPMLFINTAEDIGVKPTNCLVIEDSFHGLIAAKAALMKTIVVPDKENWDNPNYNIADFNLKSLNQIKELNFG